MNSLDSFRSRATLKVGAKSYEIRKLDALHAHGDPARLPFSLKVMLENLLRTEDGVAVTKDDVLALLKWNPKAEPDREIAFTPARVLMQDFTGVPAVVDLAAMREAFRKMGGDPAQVNPLVPAELVIDHSVQVDAYGTPEAFVTNASLEAKRNGERYAFLRWGQKAFRNFKVVPPDTGIVHQVNLEYLARVVFVDESEGRLSAYPDTLVGTDSHTTMINGLGVVGFGVGGIEAEAALLGQPVSMLIPHVVGFKLKGRLPEGATATDLVLTATQMLRKKGVVGKFVEFHGDGVAELSLADRATLANMAPEYGATIGLFPIDEETLKYLRLTGRSAEQVALVEAYCKAQGMWWTRGAPDPVYSDSLELDLATVEPSLAGPRRPQDRVSLKGSKAAFASALDVMEKERAARLAAKGKSADGLPKSAKFKLDGKEQELAHGSVVIAAITSCTNTSNPSVLVAAGLLAKKALQRGLTSRPWVKTSLAPGSQVVTNYLRKSGLLADLEALNFHVVGYGCTTCIGNSGPLRAEIHDAAQKNDLAVAAVLSGNRNFEGRIHPLVKMNYLASPPLVVAYALAGRADIDMANEPLGTSKDGKPVFLKDVWPTQKEVNETVAGCVDAAMFASTYAHVFRGDERWNALPTPEGQLFAWEANSTYVKLPPYFENLPATPPPVGDLKNARCLAVLGDSVTTDHISPAGDIPADSPAGRYLLERGVQKEEFNSYGARRGNHELMMRGTFANVRLRNLLAPGTEGGVTVHLPDGAPLSIFDASMQYQREKTPLVILAGKEYGSGSSRDWAAKGPRLLGVRVVIAESYERIHRSNLVGMGVLPLQFPAGATAQSLGLTGRETYDVTGLGDGSAKRVKVTARPDQGAPIVFEATVRIDTPKEVEYFKNGGILQYVLRRMRSAAK
ncbi:MAG TPA: aconitate hydratase AcnA [Planctomycetota bacterium]|nr:aconitate hydratase AcnA [Planctomycetota bacterium]